MMTSLRKNEFLRLIQRKEKEKEKKKTRERDMMEEGKRGGKKEGGHSSPFQTKGTNLFSGKKNRK